MFEIGEKEIKSRPPKNHKTEAPKAKAKKATDKYRGKYDVISISFPKGFSSFLKEQGNGALVTKKQNQIILEYLQETSLIQDFESWLLEQEKENE